LVTLNGHMLFRLNKKYFSF